VLRAGVLPHGRAGLGHEPAALPGPRRAGAGGARHRPPRAGHEHRVHRGPAAAPEPAGRLRLQLPQLCGRRPDRRRRGPVPAVPDPVRDRAAGRAPPGGGGELHARPVPQSRVEDPGPDPLGAERAGDPRQGAAGGSRGPRRRAGGRRRAARERDPDGCVLDRRAPGARGLPRGAGPARRSLRRVPRQRLRAEDRRRARGRQPDGMGSLNMSEKTTHETVAALLERSNTLGADPRNTNYAGGNASAKGSATDPVTGEETELLWVKGSGGDRGTVEEKGLAVLRLDRVRALEDVYPGVEREDEMVAAFDYCLHGKGGAAPSIDTAMHALVDAAHVDHLHPDAGIALATAADGERLTRECFGDAVVWVPWRRPGFQLGLDIAAIKRENPAAIGCILGGHGITAWGDTSQEAQENSLRIIREATEFIERTGAPEPFGTHDPSRAALPEAERRAKASALFPVVRGLASTDSPTVGHWTDTEAVHEFLASEKLAPLAELGTSCPDHFLRTKVKPLVLDLPADASIEDSVARLKELHETYREDYS